MYVNLITYFKRGCMSRKKNLVIQKKQVVLNVARKHFNLLKDEAPFRLHKA